MFTRKIDSFYIDTRISTEFPIRIGYLLKNSRERRGSISVAYSINGQYKEISFKLHRFPITEKNLKLFSQIKVLFNILKEHNYKKSNLEMFDEIKLKEYSVEDLIKERNDNPSIKVVAKLKNDFYNIDEQDTSNRKKIGFFLMAFQKILKMLFFISIYLNKKLLKMKN